MIINMKWKTLLTFLSVLFTFSLGAQQLPTGACGIVNVYDAAGNRTKRVYFCNNGSDPYPTKIMQEDTKTTVDILPVDALYPNPTTGKFVVTFGKALNNASVAILDVNGKVVSQFRASGNQVDFDLSRAADGVYFVRINDGGKLISKKVVKQ